MFKRSAAAVLTILAIALAPPIARAATETPAHEVVVKDDEFELRDYGPMILASVTVEAPRAEAGNRAFGTLADYIFAKGEEARGGDTIAMTAPVTTAPAASERESAGTGRETIAMTAPVTMARTEGTPGEGQWTVSFVMPVRWTMETLPQPVSEDIALSEKPGRRVATVTFAGRNTDENVGAAREQLQAWIDKRGFTPVGPPEYAFYDPPFTPPSERRNEVMIPVAQ